MSTFNGFLEEYPFISIDQFEQNNLSAAVFFLSHCHTDHMKGLKSTEFYEKISKSPGCKIYMSKVSKILLQNESNFRQIHDFLESIPIEYPTIISISDKTNVKSTNVTVTLLPSGHCPGSVMFFFEGPNGNVLYTGDFRLEIGSMRHFTCFHYEDNRIKPITRLYLDTTFCNPKSLFLPSREDCFDALSSVVEPWISKGPNYIVFLICSASIGYEYVFINLYKRFQRKTHVSFGKYIKYKNIPNILEAVTKNPNESQIHSCRKEFSEINPCVTDCGYQAPNRRPVNVRRIKLSAMFFANNVNVNDIIVCEKNEMFRVCFSTHSSMAEIQDMVSYLQPKSLSANVVPQNEAECGILKYLRPLVANDESNTKINNLGPLLQFEKAADSMSSFGSLDFNYDICLKKCRRNNVLHSYPMTSREETNDSIHFDSQLTNNSNEISVISNTLLPVSINNCESTLGEKSTNNHEVPKWNYSPCSELSSSESVEEELLPTYLASDVDKTTSNIPSTQLSAFHEQKKTPCFSNQFNNTPDEQSQTFSITNHVERSKDCAITLSSGSFNSTSANSLLSSVSVNCNSIEQNMFHTDYQNSHFSQIVSENEGRTSPSLLAAVTTDMSNIHRTELNPHNEFSEDSFEDSPSLIPQLNNEPLYSTISNTVKANIPLLTVESDQGDLSVLATENSTLLKQTSNSDDIRIITQVSSKSPTIIPVFTIESDTEDSLILSTETSTSSKKRRKSGM